MTGLEVEESALEPEEAPEFGRMPRDSLQRRTSADQCLQERARVKWHTATPRRQSGSPPPLYTRLRPERWRREDLQRIRAQPRACCHSCRPPAGAGRYSRARNRARRRRFRAGLTSPRIPAPPPKAARTSRALRAFRISFALRSHLPMRVPSAILVRARRRRTMVARFLPLCDRHTKSIAAPTTLTCDPTASCRAFVQNCFPRVSNARLRRHV